MSLNGNGKKWNRSSDVIMLGSKRIKEIYLGSKKIYPLEYTFMGLREIVEDFAAHYGDPSGYKYSWYVYFPDENIFRSFRPSDSRNRVLRCYVFCDWHAPNNGEYYGKDLSKPVGYTNWGDTYEVRNPNNPSEILGTKWRMRYIYYQCQTSETTQQEAGGAFYPYIVPVYPEWHQGNGEGKYKTPGWSLIWTDWGWWLDEDATCIFKYDFKKREFGPELTASDLWYPPE